MRMRFKAGADIRRVFSAILFQSVQGYSVGPLRTSSAKMYRLAKAALNLTGQGSRQVAVRHRSSVSADFHSKYGTPLLIAGITFCTAVWSYVVTSTGITWNLSPVGKVQPKDWKE